nr:AraC family transcriptional regulator [uncultured Bacteroides sp.]
MNTLNVSFENILNAKDTSAEAFGDDVIVYHIKSTEEKQPLDNIPSIRINAVFFIVCQYGDISFTVDYKNYRLTKGMTLSLNKIHILDDIRIGKNFEGYGLIISDKFVLSIVEDMQIIKKLTTSSRTSPLLMLENDKLELITDIIERIKRGIKATDHILQKELIKNEVSNFILEIADITYKTKLENKNENDTYKENSQDCIIQNFIMLIMGHCKEQHEVSFYAKELCITPGHLSRVLNAFSGKSAMKWISDALISEAKILLRKPDINIQQISEELHFGEQSSFSKFFKKHTGVTPVEYRNSILRGNF